MGNILAYDVIEITGEPEFGGRSAPTPQPPLIIPLEMMNEEQRWLVGGNAANLAVLLRGEPVGYYFVRSSKR